MVDDVHDGWWGEGDLVNLVGKSKQLRVFFLQKYGLFSQLTITRTTRVDQRATFSLEPFFKK